MKKTNTAISLILFALCGVSLAALTACQMGQENEDDYYDDASSSSFMAPIEQTGDVQAGFNDYPLNEMPQENVVPAQDNAVGAENVVNPYLTDDAQNYVSIQEKQNTCYQVKKGMIIPPVKPILDPSMAEPTPCGIHQAKQQAASQTVTVAQTSTAAQKPIVAPVVSGTPAVQTTKVCDNSPKSVIDPECAGIKTAEYLNIETPERCRIPLNEGVISTLPLNSSSFKMTRLDNSDSLPRYEVNNYSFKNIPLDLAIQNLVSEAGIRVYSDDALFPEVSGDKIRGELSVVLDELTSAGDVYYRYDAQKKRLILSRWSRYILSVPGGRVGMYTVLDALRGANITNIYPDFGSNEIYMRLNKEKFNTITKLVDSIKASPSLMMFDIQVYRLVKKDSKCPVDWQDLIQKFGVSRINSSVNGIMGRILAMNQQPKYYTLIDSLRKYGVISLISEGVAVMPNGWKVRFDIGQCSKFETPEQNLSMLFQSNMLAKNRAEANIALDTTSGELTAFHTLYNMGDSLNIIGIPGKVFNPDWGNNVEYIIVLKPRLLKLVK